MALPGQYRFILDSGTGTPIRVKISSTGPDDLKGYLVADMLSEGIVRVVQEGMVEDLKARGRLT